MYEMLKHRRSIRKFRDNPVPGSIVKRLLHSALLAPSSRSRRPWEFIAVTDKRLIEELALVREHGSQFLKGAPLVIAVAADPEVCDVWVEDCSIAAAIIQFTAETLELGSCWVQIRERCHPDGKPSADHVRRILQIPEELAVECLIAVGYKAEERPAYTEADLRHDKLHENAFGSPLTDRGSE